MANYPADKLLKPSEPLTYTQWAVVSKSIDLTLFIIVKDFLHCFKSRSFTDTEPITAMFLERFPVTFAVFHIDCCSQYMYRLDSCLQNVI